MEFQLQQEQFDTIGQWYAWRLGLDLAEYCEALPDGLAENQAAELRRGEAALYCFFQELLADLYLQPKAYGVPEIPYEPNLAGDQAREDRLREARLKVRKVIEHGLFDYLYQVGRMGELVADATNGAAQGSKLKISRFFFDRQIEEKKKKARTTAFLQALERLGLDPLVGKETVVFSSQRYPEMMVALSALAKECALIKDLDIFFFRRCDFRVLTQKRQPSFEDALRLAPEDYRGEARKMDALLRERKFKREILVASADGGYRFRYGKKSDAIVYWARIRSWTSQVWSHNLRWDFEGLAPELFPRMDAAAPGLAKRVFAEIKACAHCYGPSCMARVHIPYDGTVKEACKEVGWEGIGESPADFEDLRTVICLVDDLVSEKRA